MKKCTRCGIDKPLTAEYYHRASSRSSGFQSQCKVCKCKTFAEHYQNNKEKILKQKAEYRQNNKEKIAEYRQNNKEKNAEHYQNNKEKIAKDRAEHYQNNKETIAKRQAEYRQNNKEKIAKYRAEYYQNNKEEIIKQQTEYRQNNKEKIAEHYQNKKDEQPGCVYQIVNSVNNKIYIGETTRGELRWKGHLRDLRGNYHRNHKLQADFDKFGEEVFTWSIIEEYPKDKDTLLLEEINTIHKLLREGKELYNISLMIDQLKLLTENK